MAAIFISMDKLTQLAASRMIEADLNPSQTQCAAEALTHADAQNRALLPLVKKGGVNLKAGFPLHPQQKPQGDWMPRGIVPMYRGPSPDTMRDLSAFIFILDPEIFGTMLTPIKCSAKFAA